MSLKIISWNVNGLRACLRKNCLRPCLEKEQPDILCLQETKGNEEQLKEQLKELLHKQISKNPHDKPGCIYGDFYSRKLVAASCGVLDQFSLNELHYFNSAKKAGYAGTAVLSKIKPRSVSYGMRKEKHDQEGRVITLEFDNFFLVNVYVPNSGRGLPRLEYRKTWDKDFLDYLKKLEEKKPVIACGDFNVAHTEFDLANPKENYNKTAGYTQIEIDGFTRLIDGKFIDTFREFEKKGGHYTYWGQWNNLRARNIGWRIDYFLISESLRPKLRKSLILPNFLGSDHCPIELEIDLPT